jgi:hypothetical protein
MRYIYVVIWLLNSLAHRKWKADAKNVRRLRLSHCETKLATAGHTISLWNLGDRKVIKVRKPKREVKIVSVLTRLFLALGPSEIHWSCFCGDGVSILPAR